MKTLIDVMTVLGGATLSLTVGVLLEELIFGKVFCPLFARRIARIKSGPKP